MTIATSPLPFPFLGFSGVRPYRSCGTALTNHNTWQSLVSRGPVAKQAVATLEKSGYVFYLSKLNIIGAPNNQVKSLLLQIYCQLGKLLDKAKQTRKSKKTPQPLSSLSPWERASYYEHGFSLVSFLMPVMSSQAEGCQYQFLPLLSTWEGYLPSVDMQTESLITS